MIDLEWFTIVHSSVWISQPVLLCRMQSFGLSAYTEQTLKELQQQQQMANEFNCESFSDISVTCMKETDLAWMHELYQSSSALNSYVSGTLSVCICYYCKL